MTGLYWDDDGSEEALLMRRSAGRCLSEQEITGFLLNRLSGVTREVIEEHLLICPHCLDSVEQEEKLREELVPALERYETERLLQGSQPHEGDKPDFHEGWWGKRVWMSGAVAGLAAAVVLGILLFRPAGRMSEVEIALRAERGAAAQPVALAGHALRLKPDLSGLPARRAFRYTIVDHSGARVVAGSLDAGRDDGVLRLSSGLKAGQYWVRIADPESGLLLREYALAVR